MTVLANRVVSLGNALQHLNKGTNAAVHVLSENDKNLIQNNIPIDTYEQLTQFDAMLADESDLKNALIGKYKIKVKDVDGRSRALQIIDEFITRKLMVQMSWTGARTSKDAPAKNPFQGFKNIIDLFDDICIECDSEHTLADTEKFFKNVLQNAGTRLKRGEMGVKRVATARKYGEKKKKKPNEPTSSDNSNASNTAVTHITVPPPGTSKDSETPITNETANAGTADSAKNNITSNDLAIKS